MQFPQTAHKMSLKKNLQLDTLCVCVCTRTCVRTYMCVCVYTYVCAHIHVCECMNVWYCVYMCWKCIYLKITETVRRKMCAGRIPIHDIYLHTLTHTHTHTYIYIYIYTFFFFSLLVVFCRGVDFKPSSKCCTKVVFTCPCMCFVGLPCWGSESNEVKNVSMLL